MTHRTRHPQRAVHRPDTQITLRVTDAATGDTLVSFDGPLLKCLNLATPELDAGCTLTITPQKDKP